LVAFILFSLSLQAAGPVSVTSAARSGDREAVRKLLMSGADVNAAEADGMTALHWAVTRDDLELVDMLLHAGANVRATTRLGGYTALLMAAKNGNSAIVEKLLSAGADVNDATTSGTTVLMFAAASGQVPLVQKLIEAEARLNAQETSRGETALHFAAAFGRPEVIRVLIAHGADPRISTKVVDLSIYTKEEEEFGQPTPRKKADSQNAQSAEPAPPATKRADSSKIPGVERKYFYNELVGTQGGLTPLLFAARQGDVESVQALLAGGADVNQRSSGDGTTPLLIATINGRFDLAKFLLDRGADPRIPSQNGVTPLYAVLNCQWSQKALYPQPRAYEQQNLSYLELMQELMDRGADPNARIKQKVWYSGYNSDFSTVDEDGATPFWRAAYAADVDAMRLLVSRGADPNLRTTKTPGRPRAGGGITDDFKDVSGLPPVPVGGPAISPLHAATGEGYGEGFAGNAHRYAPAGLLPAVKYLVDELHADVNAVDPDGNTPLHNAASRGDNEMIRYLVAKGANPLAVNRAGQTTVDMANGPVQRVQPFPETIALLEKLGAKNNHKCVSC
jgi:ankyrin repeat protein